VDLARRQAAKAATRDDAMQRLRDLTLAVAIAACGALGVFAWLSATTIPGSASTTTQPSIDDSQFATTQAGDDSNQPAAFAPARAGGGSAFAVSGGSH
jgi:hypothetical protein